MRESRQFRGGRACGRARRQETAPPSVPPLHPGPFSRCRWKSKENIAVPVHVKTRLALVYICVCRPDPPVLPPPSQQRQPLAPCWPTRPAPAHRLPHWMRSSPWRCRCCRHRNNAGPPGRIFVGMRSQHGIRYDYSTHLEKKNHCVKPNTPAHDGHRATRYTAVTTAEKPGFCRAC